MRYAILLTVCSTGVFLCLVFETGIAAAQDTPEGIWKELEKFKAAHSVSYERVLNGQIVENGQSYSHGDHALVLIERGKEVTAYLSNPKYSATIGKHDDEQFRVRWLANEKPLFGANTPLFSDMLYMQVLNPAEIAIVLRKPELSNGVKQLASNDGITYTIAHDLPKDCGIHPGHAGANVRVYYESGNYPKRCEILDSELHGGKGTRLEYSSFEDVDGMILPSRVKASMISEFDGVGKNETIFSYDYAKMQVPFDLKRCFLSYYGLAEPGRGKWAAAKWLIMLIVVAAVVCGLVFFWRRSRIANT